MKKICAIIMAAAMVLSLCACNIKDVTKMASVGDEYVSKGEFNYYLLQGKSMALQAASQAGETLTQNSSAEDWNTVMIDGKTAAQYAVEKTKDTLREVLVLKAKALSEGITLTEEDKENIKTQRQNIIDQYGGRYNYEQYFSEAGFTLEDVENILTDSAYAQKAYEKYFGDGSDESGEIKITDEQAEEFYNNEFVYVKHILISNTADAEESETDEEVAENEELNEEAAEDNGEAENNEADNEADEPDAEDDADAKAKAKAEDIIKQLEDGADFDKLMKENSDDVNSQTGELNGADGYVFTKNQMLPEFEEASYALQVGDFTKEPVKTSVGYHIILRLELPTKGELYEEGIENAKSAALSDVVDSTVNKWAEELGLVFNDKAISRVKIAD